MWNQIKQEKMQPEKKNSNTELETYGSNCFVFFWLKNEHLYL